MLTRKEIEQACDSELPVALTDAMSITVDGRWTVGSKWIPSVVAVLEVDGDEIVLVNWDDRKTSGAESITVKHGNVSFEWAYPEEPDD